jgi:Protein of unknown function (DUF3455)
LSFPKNAVLTAIFLTGSFAGATAQTPLPAEIAAPGETAILTLHAEGAQVYECKAGADGTLVWAFREPIATLVSSGKTVGRHYAGPNWEYSDGSAVVGQVVGTAPGMVANDIPWLKLGVTSRRGTGVLSQATTVQRINTAGGKLSGACYKSGTYESVPYSADYVFLRKG